MRLRGLLSNAALATAAVLAALGLGELLVRVLHLGPEFQVVFRQTIAPSDDRDLDYELRPGAADGAAAISSAGLRDREFSTPKPPGVFRIAAIGDSVTYGSGGPRELAWPKRLEERLAGLSATPAWSTSAPPGEPPIEVLNLGVPGYNVTQVVRRLRLRGLAFDPDLVVYGYVLNDPQAYSLEGAALHDMREAAARGEPPGAGAAVRWLSHSRLFLLVHALVTSNAARSRAVVAGLPPDPAYAASDGPARDAYFRGLHADAEGARRLSAGFAELAALSREHGLRVLVAIFPLFDEGGPDTSLADVHAEVAELARRAGLDVLDLLPAYRLAGDLGRRGLRIDFLHPSPFGQRIAAAAMLDHLCRTGALPAAVDCARRTEGDSLDAALSRSLAAPRPAGG